MPDIIIVEDNKEIGTLLCDFLRRENYTVSLADTGEKALSIFEQYGAKLLVLDIGSRTLPRKTVQATITSMLIRPSTFTCSIFAISLAILLPLTMAGSTVLEAFTTPDTLA